MRKSDRGKTDRDTTGEKQGWKKRVAASGWIKALPDRGKRTERRSAYASCHEEKKGGVLGKALTHPANQKAYSGLEKGQVRDRRMIGLDKLNGTHQPHTPNPPNIPTPRRQERR